MQPKAVEMGQAICRCGQPLNVPAGAVTHLTCPRCSAKVRIIRKGSGESATPGKGPSPASSGDGYVRFSCPCGRKLKVSLLERPTHGKCPECGRVVPVPADAAAYVSPESPTEEMPAADRDRLEAWTRSHLGPSSGVKSTGPPSTAIDVATEAAAEPDGRPRPIEAGLRVCPQCGKPVHMGSETCRGCGTTVPKR